MQKGQAQVLILAGIVILLAVAGGIFYLGRITAPKLQNITTSPTPQPSPVDETANWKTYTNTKYGYSLKYPPETILEEKPGDVVFLDKQIYIAVTSSDPEQCRGDCPVIQKKEEVIINGISSKKLTGYIGEVGGSVPQSYQTIVIPYNNKFYTFTVYELKYDENQLPTREIGSVPEAKVDLLNQILSTFKFTN